MSDMFPKSEAPQPTSQTIAMPEPAGSEIALPTPAHNTAVEDQGGVVNFGAPGAIVPGNPTKMH